MDLWAGLAVSGYVGPSENLIGWRCMHIARSHMPMHVSLLIIYISVCFNRRVGPPRFDAAIVAEPAEECGTICITIIYRTDNTFRGMSVLCVFLFQAMIMLTRYELFDSTCTT